MQNKLSSSVKVVFRYACKLMTVHPQKTLSGSGYYERVFEYIRT